MYTQAAARGTQAQGDRHALRTTADRAGRLFLGTTAPEPAPRRASPRRVPPPLALPPFALDPAPNPGNNTETESGRCVPAE
jgi:hypothetical protein